MIYEFLGVDYIRILQGSICNEINHLFIFYRFNRRWSTSLFLALIGVPLADPSEVIPETCHTADRTTPSPFPDSFPVLLPVNGTSEFNSRGQFKKFSYRLKFSKIGTAFVLF